MVEEQIMNENPRHENRVKNSVSFLKCTKENTILLLVESMTKLFQ